MKALSLWQPWASLIAAGVKRFETRPWRTRHRGPLAIHAARRLDTDLPPELAALCARTFGRDWPATLPRGALVATAELADVIPTDAALRSGQIGPAEHLCGDYAPGRYAWRLARVRPLAPPVPYRGRQGLFTVPDEVVGMRLERDMPVCSNTG